MTDYVLEILDGDRAGETVSLGSGTLKIGRRPGNDLVLADEKVSGQHAELAAEGESFVLRDLDSRNGTFLDDRQISEVALSAGDVVRIGRVYMRFGPADEAGHGGAVAAADGSMAVTRLDVGGRRRKSSSKAPLIMGVLALAVGGVFAWWQWGRGDAAGPAGRKAIADPLRVSGNMLDSQVGSLESADGWLLDAAGDGFQPSSPGHTGLGAVMATSSEGEVGGSGVDGADQAPSRGFALARLVDPIVVNGGTGLTVSGHLRAAGGATGALRVWFTGDQAMSPSLRTGTAFSAPGPWTKAEFSAVVPTGCSQAWVELVARFDEGAGGTVWFDDIAVVLSGTEESAAGVAATADSGATVLAVAGGAAVRSLSAEQPFIVRRIAPYPPAGAAHRVLSEARLGGFTDSGRAITVSATGNDLRYAVEQSLAGESSQVAGAVGVRLELPQGAGANLLAQAAEDAPFLPVDDPTNFRAARVLFGAGPTRGMLQLDGVFQLALTSVADRDVLDVPADVGVLRVSFAEERQRARGLMTEAAAHWSDARPGQALRVVDKIVSTTPHDTEILAEALMLRAEMRDRARARLDAAEAELQEAVFFSTEGGFRRVRDELTTLVAQYEPMPPPDPERVAALTARAEEALGAFEAERAKANGDRLADLLGVFQAEGETALAGLIEGYLTRHGNGGGK